MRRLLVTGFGPFPGAPSNPSATLARRLAARPGWHLAGWAVRAAVLPVTWEGTPPALAAALRAHSPDAVLMLGLAGRARAPRVERLARGRPSPLSPDAAGRRVPRVLPAPAPRPAERASARLLPALRAAGLPARPSHDAGRYLCDLAFHAALGNGPAGRVAFVHLPRPRRGTARRGSRAARRPSLAAMERGLAAAVRAMMREPPRGAPTMGLGSA